MHIQKGNISGVISEMKRLIKKDREYILEWKETKDSRRKRIKTKHDDIQDNNQLNKNHL